MAGIERPACRTGALALEDNTGVSMQVARPESGTVTVPFRQGDKFLISTAEFMGRRRPARLRTKIRTRVCDARKFLARVLWLG
jgi:hypothetical protein